MRKNGRFICDGNHLSDWNPDEDDGEAIAEYFRECASCGLEVNVCLDHRDRIFLCPRCFHEQNDVGKDQARVRGRAREKDRDRKRRERRRVCQARAGEQLLWTVEQLFGG